MVSHGLVAILAAAGAALATPVDVRDVAAVKESCTTTLEQFPPFDLDPTKTVWTTIATATQEVNCGGCANVTMMRFPVGPGPVVVFNTAKFTVTAATPTTSTHWVCSRTPTADA